MLLYLPRKVQKRLNIDLKFCTSDFRYKNLNIGALNNDKNQKSFSFSSQGQNWLEIFVLTLFWMGFFMYVKGMGSKIFKNDPKKLKLTPKLENIKSIPKYKEKICSDPYFWWCQHFFGKKSQKVAKF